MKRMSMRQFGRIVAEVMDSLPEELHQHLTNLVVDVEQEPSKRKLLRMGFTEEEIEEGDTLYGVYERLRLGPHSSETLDLADRPARIVIYKRPLEQDYEDREELLKQIRKTVIHEVAHHFGYSDEDMRRWTTVY